MPIMVLALEGLIHWAITAEDPETFELASCPGCSVVNPVLYTKIIESRDVERELMARPTFIEDGVYHFVSNVLFLAVADNLPTIPWGTPDFMLAWERNISGFISHLRCASKQASLKPRLRSFGPWGDRSLPLLELPQKGEACATGSWSLRTAVRGEHLLRAGQQPLHAHPPSHTILLLDAIDRLTPGEYTTAFVLAAISIDHLIRAMAEEAIRAAFDSTREGSLLITLPPRTSPESRSERVDALAHLLVERQNVDNLLDRVPFALTGKSLRRDNRKLFNRVKEIFSLRNRIVHKDLAFKCEDLPRFIGFDDAVEAVRCAVELARWFGAESNYAHPFDGERPAICSAAIA